MDNNYNHNNNFSTDIFNQKPPFESSSMTIYSSNSAKSDTFKKIDEKTNLQKTLLEFTTAYLIESPIDIVDYAVKYFTRIQEKRRRLSLGLKENLKAEDLKREPVFTEIYEPENDCNLPVYIPKTPEQFARLSIAIKRIPVFQYLEEEQLIMVLDAMFEKSVKRGEIIIRQNDDGEHFYVIESGTFNIIKDGIRIYSWENEGTFGEIALMYQIKRTATVQATTDGLLWVMDRQTFKRILLQYSYKKHKMYVGFLENMSLLKGLDLWERLSVAEVLEPKYFQKGDVIINADDFADGMYFIEKGHVLVYVDRKDSGAMMVNKLGPSEYFGELALLMHDKRQATVIADTDVKLAFLNKDAFERVLGKCTDILNRTVESNYFKDGKIKSYLATIKSKSEHEE